MTLLAALTNYLGEFWARDKDEPPYPLTYDEMDHFQQQCPQKEREEAAPQRPPSPLLLAVENSAS